MEELIGLVDETELNAMVIDVKNDEGNVTFRLMNEEITQNIPVLDQISEMQAGVCYIRDIQALMQELKDHNIYTIARIVCFKDPILAAARPELALTKPDGQAGDGCQRPGMGESIQAGGLGISDRTCRDGSRPWIR